MKNKYRITLAIISILAIISCSTSQNLSRTSELPLLQKFDPDTVTFSNLDFGKMWTFEHAPVDYLSKRYDFAPDENWFEHVKNSTLRFASWCSASFVSGDGLILTNHHCVDFIINSFEQEGEDIPGKGFIAATLEEERKVPGVFVDQLAFVKDVTEEINEAIRKAEAEGKSSSDAISAVSSAYASETGLVCEIEKLYNGGKYSLYGFKRYNDIRVVLVVEREIGLYGGDPDNFTYPRYNLDFSLLRVYEDDKPLKNDYYFAWDAQGPAENELIFVPGNPGQTNRHKTSAQLEFFRDFTVRNQALMLNGMQDIYSREMKRSAERAEELAPMFFMISNSAKVFAGQLEALQDPYLFARKRAFEKDFSSRVNSSPELKIAYGNLSNDINSTLQEARKHYANISSFKINVNSASVVLRAASKHEKLSAQLSLPEEERDAEYQKTRLDSTLTALFGKNFYEDFEMEKLALLADLLAGNLPSDDPAIKKIFNGLKGIEGAKWAMSNSVYGSPEKLIKASAQGGSALNNPEDPLVYFFKEGKIRLENSEKIYKEIKETEKVLEEKLGRAVADVYGTSLSPDATMSPRFTEGVLRSYEYNGTIAPVFTTFHGLYDRYYSHNKKYPWDLPERWRNPSADFDLSTRFNFISTNDITGGNSGSPVISKDLKLIGLAFDGNIESLAGDFLYLEEKNRMVGVSASAILEAVSDIYGLKRIAEELIKGNISN